MVYLQLHIKVETWGTNINCENIDTIALQVF